MKLDGFGLFVDDMGAMIRFYRDILGFEIKEAEDTSNVYLIKDGTLFLLYGRKDFETMTKRKYEYVKGLNGHFELALYVDTYHDSHCMDKEVLITIQKAVDSSPELRSKKDLIENFIAGINEVEDVMDEWHSYVAEEREKALQNIIDEEKLKEVETRQFIEGAFRDGTVKTTGTDIDKILPAVSRFGGGNRKEKKETVIEKLKAFFERFWNIG